MEIQNRELTHEQSMIGNRKVTEDGKLITFRNPNGDIIFMQGTLPNGQVGYWIDEAQPFTDAELEDVELLEKHLHDFAKRVNKQMSEEN